MPIGPFEREVLRLLAANRNPDSYVAGGTVLNQDVASPRTSQDVDVFHDTLASLTESVDRDLATLKAAGFEVTEAGRKLIATLPPDEVGCLYLDARGKPVCPDPGSSEFPRLIRHYGSVKGAWPRIVDAECGPLPFPGEG